MSVSMLSLRRLCLGLWACSSLMGLSTQAAEDAKQPLPLKRVVMLNSGVGFFEHAGTIDGNSVIEFPVNVADINDLLKSLVVQDQGGGRVTAVNYGSPEPISQTLKTLAIDVTRNPSLAQIIHQLRGQKVELTVASDTKPVVGTVAGVERRRLAVGREQQVVDQDIILLRTEAGLRSVTVDSVMLTKFSDPKTDREFQQALDLLAEARQQDRKQVKLDFRGQGQRPVSVGYVQESPIWKTTYRLVLDDEQPPFLQGWAIVENTTAQDWTDVSLTLMSGRPISFQMDLYQPLFASRPVVGLNLHTSVSPRTYYQDLFAREDEFLAAGTNAGGGPLGSTRRNINLGGYGGGQQGGFGGGGFGGQQGGGGGGGFFGGGQQGGGQQGGGIGGGMLAEPGAKPKLNLAEGVESSATAEDIGDSFRYVMKTPVTLKRHESAMLPIVNDPIKGAKVYIFNPAVHAKHPLAGLKLTNSTELHFQQGPITVFDGGEYAGDARIADIPPGSTRLLTYAMDLDTEVVAKAIPSKTELVALSIQSGGLLLKSRETRRHEYTVKNSGSRAKRLLIERPVDANWPHVQPKPEEQTRDQYRFAKTAEPGKPSIVAVTETRDIEERIVVQSMTVAQCELYLESKAAAPKLLAALKELILRKTALNQLTAAREVIEKAIQSETTEQQRLRENLKVGSLDNTLHQRYLKKFGASEDQLEKQREQLATARAEEARAQKDFEAFAANLAVE